MGKNDFKEIGAGVEKFALKSPCSFAIRHTAVTPYIKKMNETFQKEILYVLIRPEEQKIGCERIEIGAVPYHYDLAHVHNTPLFKQQISKFNPLVYLFIVAVVAYDDVEKNRIQHGLIPWDSLGDTS